MVLGHDSAACVLYHKNKKSFLFVRQFRPGIINLLTNAVFVHIYAVSSPIQSSLQRSSDYS